jgi:hypothetical protein
MTPNVARLLRKWGVDEEIGDDLVRFRELNMRIMDGTPVGYTKISGVEEACGQPWWLVHRYVQMAANNFNFQIWKEINPNNPAAIISIRASSK